MQKCRSAVRSSPTIGIVCATGLLMACAGGDDRNNPSQADSAIIASGTAASATSAAISNYSTVALKRNAEQAASDADPALKLVQSNQRTRVASATQTTSNKVTLPTTNPNTSQALVAVPANGLAVTDPKFQRLYGPGVYVMDALADFSIGVVNGYHYIAAHRFRAPSTGRATALQVYWPSGAGYAAGNGGKISIRILPDDGSGEHLPNLNAQPLSTATYEPGLILGRHVYSSYNDVVRLGSSAPLIGGQLYHVVYENLDGDPAANHIGINNVVTVERNGRPARWLDPIDWSSLFGYRVANTQGAFTWKDAGRVPSAGLYYAPILQLTLDNGAMLGAVDIETGNVEGERLWSIDTNRPIRERFTPRVKRVISGFSVSTAAASPGELEWSIRQGALVLASGVISETTPNYATQFNTRLTQGVFKWYDIALPSTVSFEAGRDYELQFTPRRNSQWRFADEYNGSDQGYAIAFSESQAQVLVSGQWINANHRSQTSQGPSSNWRVVLHLAP